MLIRLYFNDPQGGRWNKIIAAVAELKKIHAFEVEIVKKTSFGLLERLALPKFPAIEIDGTVAFQGCDVSQEQLDQAIRDASGGRRRAHES